MSDSAEFRIGCEVACGDGPCGELTRVVVDPVARALTHLVVEPRHKPTAGRLVPVELVESASEERIVLRVSRSELEALDEAAVTSFLPTEASELGYEPGQVLALPYFGLGFGPRIDVPMLPHVVTHDRVPLGEVDVRRGDHVEATDGPIGRVQGLVIDPADRHVTHFLLEEGHLWGRKVVAIPIGAVADVSDGVRLTLTREQVGALPPVELARNG